MPQVSLQETILLAIWFLVCYLIGVLQIGDLLTRKAGFDIRNSGTGNPGASNIYSELGPAFGIAVFFLDVGKGLMPVIICNITNQPSFVLALSVFSLLAGHQLRFPWQTSGGTGMATAMGAGIGILPLGAAVALLPSAGILLMTRQPSYTGVAAFFITMVAGWLIYRDLILCTAVLILSAAVLIKFKFQYRHLAS
jgi:glycerol-3-phosphate acyltransferase PlsY